MIAALLATACSPQDSAAVAQAPTETAPTTPAATPAPETKPAIEAAFREGMPFAELRKQLLAAGWLPLRDPMCRENVGGTAEVCFALPEVESCSGDGYCKMHYANAAENRRISVTTYGPYDQWDVPGQESALAVRSWKASALPAPETAAPACPSADFDAFLKAFASDEKIERAFTAPLVKVAMLGGGESGDDQIDVYERSGGYDGFLLRYQGDAWRLKPVEGSPQGAPADIQVTAEPDGQRYVTLPGSVEGISYRFAMIDGCWRLVADPDVVP
jgi:hypothetical protein